MWTPLSTVVALSWVLPPALTIALWWWLKPRLRQGLAFVILGTLVVYGLQLVVSHIVVSLPASVPKDLSEGERFVRILRINGYRILVISLICAVPLIVWFHRLISGRGSVPKTPNNRWRGRESR